jgi:hypothetical protein
MKMGEASHARSAEETTCTLSVLIAVLLMTVGVACSGLISDVNPPNASAGRGGQGVQTPLGGGTAGSPGSSTPSPMAANCSGSLNPGRAPLRRLNDVEYANTIRDLIGAPLPASVQLPPDDEGLGFTNNSDAMVVTGLLAQTYIDAAEAIATNAVTMLGTLSSCQVAQSGEAACAGQFVASFGKRAFRRPLTNEEVTRYVGLYTMGRTGQTYADGISVVIQAFLQSPYFLYRVEDTSPAPGQPAALLSPYEMAARMSYFLWGSMPDDQLLAAADAGALATRDQVAAQAQRMLKDPRAQQMVSTFHREWLELDHAIGAPKATMLYPNWTPQLASDLLTESQTFADQTFWTDGKLETLLTAPYSYANANVAHFYGVPAPTGTGFAQVMLDSTERAGLLTQGTFLAAQADPDQDSPVLRGKFVRTQLLCQAVPPPPNNIVIMPPAYAPDSTTRQRFSTHETQAICSACHALMDHIGFAFEEFDAIGQYRTMDGPGPVDSSGTLTGTDVDGDFNGAVELASKLAASQDVAACVATQWFRWANGRAEDVADQCVLTDVRGQFTAAGNDMRTLPLAIVTSDTFRYRAANGGSP